jgi:hypothetical protein
MLKGKLKICDECFHYLALKNTSVASFWCYLCTLYVNKLTPRKRASQFDSRFTMLEEEGFLMTMEVGTNTLGIMLFGCNDDRQVICLNKHVSDINV